jgi:hypothetical protein
MAHKSLRPNVKITLVSVVVLAGTLSSCLTEPDFNYPKLVFYGYVTSQDNEPIQGAEVTISPHPGCADLGWVPFTVGTNPAGHYRGLLLSTPECAKLAFTAPGFEPDSVIRDIFERGTLPPDSIRTDMVLRRTN